MSRRVAVFALGVFFFAALAVPVQSADAEVVPAPGCTVDERLVNSCRPWFGTSAHNYPEVANYWSKLEQMLYGEQRMGRQVEVAHSYRIAGQNELRAEDLYFANRDNTILLMNYQVTRDWSTADGTDDAVNAQIDQMAASVKALGDREIMIAVHHEPENDVTSTAGCTGLTHRGTSGTPEEYRAMWANVRSRFDAAGVTNVVWVMNYMNYEPFNCMVEELYPGDDLVDWIVWNAYQHGNQDVSFVGEASNLYEYFEANSNEEHDYVSKAWGLSEWGINQSTQQNAYLYYQQAKAAVEGNVLPRLKLYASFDNGDPNTGDGSYRVAYGTDDVFDQVEQDAFNAFAHSWAFQGDGTQPETEPDDPPSVPTSLAAEVMSSNQVWLTWGAAVDDHAVASYDVFRDGGLLASSPDPSYLDVTAVPGQRYEYTVRAVDDAAQAGDESSALSVTIPAPDRTAPSRPTGVAATLSAGQPRLSWRASTDNVGVVAYDVLRNGVLAGTTSSLVFVDSAARQGTTHTYTVRARDLAGNLSPLSTAVRRSVPDSTPPAAPGDLRVTRSRTSATLTWTRPTDNVAVTGYVVYRGTTVVSRPGASTLRATVSGLRSGTTYSFRVVARDAAGNLSAGASVSG